MKEDLEVNESLGGTVGVEGRDDGDESLHCAWSVGHGGVVHGDGDGRRQSHLGMQPTASLDGGGP